MSFPEVIFKIVDDMDCPLYEMGDEFKLSGKTLLLEREDKIFVSTTVIKTSHDKPVCRIFYSDLASVLIQYESILAIPAKHFIKCSGCTGKIRLRRKREKTSQPPPVTKGKYHEEDIGFATLLLNKFPIFQTLTESEIKRLIPMLKMKKFPKGSTILKKGDPASNLYIILSGKAEVLVDEGISIGVMERGDVFGEISLLIGTPVGATIKVAEVVTVLMIYGKDFKKVLKMFPSMQMYFAQLLAKRLAKTNVERLEDFTSGMIGKLADNPPAEIFQTLNLNHKSGILMMYVSKGTGEMAFREGSLIRAKYNEKEGREAFFELLKETDGRFKFTPGLPEEDVEHPELGDFMWLLMEGSRRMDEDVL